VPPALLLRFACDVPSATLLTVPGGRWTGVPRAVRVFVTATVVVLGNGTVVHLLPHGVGGLNPYPHLAGWLAGYFIALTLLDPLAAVLLWFRSRVGLVLACLVLTSDAVANG
jgi:hypothetical protein